MSAKDEKSQQPSSEQIVRASNEKASYWGHLNKLIKNWIFPTNPAADNAHRNKEKILQGMGETHLRKNWRDSRITGERENPGGPIASNDPCVNTSCYITL